MHGYLRHRFSVTFNQVIVATVKLPQCMTSAQQLETPGSVTSMLAATLVQGNHDKNINLQNIVSAPRNIYFICLTHVCLHSLSLLRKSFDSCPFTYDSVYINRKHTLVSSQPHRFHSVLASSAVNSGFSPLSCERKDYKIGICCFSAKRAVQYNTISFIQNRKTSNITTQALMSF